MKPFIILLMFFVGILIGYILGDYPGRNADYTLDIHDYGDGKVRLHHIRDNQKLTDQELEMIVAALKDRDTVILKAIQVVKEAGCITPGIYEELLMQLIDNGTLLDAIRNQEKEVLQPC